MKILMITGCVCAEDCNRTHFTGLDYIVSDIAQRIGIEHEVTIFTTTPYPKTSKLENTVIKSYSYKDLLKYISFRDLKRYIGIAKLEKATFKEKIKAIRAFLVMRFLQNEINNGDYDLLHMHGADITNTMLIEVGAANDIPVLFTLHGVLSFGGAYVSERVKLDEEILLEMISKKNHQLSVISTGIKNAIMEKFLIDEKKIGLIYNAINIPVCTNKYDIREKYDIRKDRKIIICVGSIGKRKNQIQLVRAFSKMAVEKRNQFCVLLLGVDTTNGEINREIEKHGLGDCFRVCGFIDKSELVNFYEVAELNVILSKSEGFGLSFIEAAYFGIPTLTFADLDLVKDIYSKEIMMLIPDREDVSVAEALVSATEHIWNREKIKEKAQEFTSDIYLKYVSLYQEIIDQNINYYETKEVLYALGIEE